MLHFKGTLDEINSHASTYLSVIYLCKGINFLHLPEYAIAK